jgi:hypothetical protein
MQSNWLDEVFWDIAQYGARKLSRRGMLKRTLDMTFKGSLVLFMGAAGARKAWAQACTCSPAGGRFCTGCPTNPGGCPTGMMACRTVNGVRQDVGCIHGNTTGSWDEDCLDGNCVTCTDCWSGTPNTSCTCRSNTYPGPCTPPPPPPDCGPGLVLCGTKCCDSCCDSNHCCI